MKRRERPKVKKIYMDVLVRLAPGPIGKGMKIKEVAEDLGVAESTVYYRLRIFKKKYPEAWKNFIGLRKLARDDRYKLRWKRNSKQKFYIETGGVDPHVSDKCTDFLSYAEERGYIRYVF